MHRGRGGELGDQHQPWSVEPDLCHCSRHVRDQITMTTRGSVCTHITFIFYNGDDDSNGNMTLMIVVGTVVKYSRMASKRNSDSYIGCRLRRG